MSRKIISCVIACYKDAQAIPVMYERIVKTFEDLPVDYEIIFVNDASPDETISELKKITERDSKVIGINHRRNFGSQAAFLSGMMQSKGDAVVLMDGDLQDPPELIKDFYKKWVEGFNVVYGVRTKREVSFWMQLAYRIFYLIFNRVASFQVPVNAGDFSLIDKESVEEILSFKEYDIFLRAIRAYIGGKQVGIPYLRPERMFGKSTNNFLRNIGWATKGILSVSRVPLILISFAATLLVTLTFIFGIIYFLYVQKSNTFFANGFVQIISIVNLLILLVTILSLAIIGEYVGRILEGIKNRPRFIVDNFIVNGEIVKKL